MCSFVVVFIVCIVQHLVTYCKERVKTTEELQTVECFIRRLFCDISVPTDALIKNVESYSQKYECATDLLLRKHSTSHKTACKYIYTKKQIHSCVAYAQFYKRGPIIKNVSLSQNSTTYKTLIFQGRLENAVKN